MPITESPFAGIFVFKVTFLVTQRDIPVTWKIRREQKNNEGAVRQPKITTLGILSLRDLFNTLTTNAFRLRYASARYNNQTYRVTFIWVNDGRKMHKTLVHTPGAVELMQTLCQTGQYYVLQFNDDRCMSLYCKPELQK